MSKKILNPSQRKALIEALVDDFVDTVQQDDGVNYAEGVAEHGFIGYRAMSDRHLVESAQAQGLDGVLEDEQVPELQPGPTLATAERQRLINELVARFEADAREVPHDDGENLLTLLARKGFRGYAYRDDEELIAEAKKASIAFSVKRPRKSSADAGQEG